MEPESTMTTETAAASGDDHDDKSKPEEGESGKGKSKDDNNGDKGKDEVKDTNPTMENKDENKAETTVVKSDDTKTNDTTTTAPQASSLSSFPYILYDMVTVMTECPKSPIRWTQDGAAMFLYFDNQRLKFLLRPMLIQQHGRKYW